MALTRNGGKPGERSVMGYADPYGPKNRTTGPGLGQDNCGNSGTQGKGSCNPSSSGSPGLGGRNLTNCGSQGKR